MNLPFVSVIVTTKNNHATLEACLQSIQSQTYKNLEIVVVDNDSSDDTKDIARQFTNSVYNKGPERSTQRNYAVDVAKGNYVAIIDSDMELKPEVIAACVNFVSANPQTGGVIIPEESFGLGFWAQCKRLERSFYVGNDTIEAARFYRRDLYRQVGGFDIEMVSGEDWDLSRRIQKLAPIGRIDQFIMHNEGRLRLGRTLQKKYYYAGLARGFLQKNQVNTMTSKEGPLARYKLFFSRPGHLFKNPIVGVGMLFMKTCEYAAGAAGYFLGKPKEKAGQA
jgi:glycosyltransferase involved in cell wall biosynthesis